MSNTFSWWGFDRCRTVPGDQSGAIGVVVGGQRMLNSTYAAAKRIHAAGPDGLSVDSVNRSDVDILRSAGMGISSDPLGMRYRLANLPEPSSSIVVAPEPDASKPRGGQYGSTGIPKRH